MTLAKVLRGRLAEARTRREGFEDGWPVALAAAVGASSSGERDGWVVVLAGMELAWRSAFERRAPVWGLRCRR